MKMFHAYANAAQLTFTFNVWCIRGEYLW